MLISDSGGSTLGVKGGGEVTLEVGPHPDRVIGRPQTRQAHAAARRATPDPCSRLATTLSRAADAGVGASRSQSSQSPRR